MKVRQYQQIGKIVEKIANNSSITQLYRSVELNPEAIRVNSEFGNAECWHEPTSLETTSLVSASAFLGVVQSLPEESELTLTRTEQQVQWKCGDAKGHWSLQSTPNGIPTINHDKFDWVPPKELVKAIALGSAACQASTVSTGLYGMLIEVKGDTLRLMSSNNISFAMAVIDKTNYTGPNITLRPPVPGILSTLLTISAQALVDITSEGVFVVSPWFVAQLPLSPPLEMNIVKIVEGFSDNKFPAKVEANSIKAFLNRAGALADKGVATYITFKVENGRMLLQHESVASSAEEYFLAGGLDPTKDFQTVKLPLSLLKTSIEHVNSATMDYLEKNVLILRGDNPEFIHIIGGQQQRRKGSRSKQV